MIYLCAFLSLFLGWMTDEMLYQQGQQQQDANLPPPVDSGQKEKLPGPTPSTPVDRRANLANEPGKSTRGLRTDDPSQQAIYWLSLVDQGQFSGSWLAGGSLLRDVVSQDQWVAAMQGTRPALGLANSRKAGTQSKLSQLPNGTHGTFTQVIYRTQFSQGGPRSEIVILMSEGRTAQWKVISYQIKK